MPTEALWHPSCFLIFGPAEIGHRKRIVVRVLVLIGRSALVSPQYVSRAVGKPWTQNIKCTEAAGANTAAWVPIWLEAAEHMAANSITEQ